MKMLPLKIIFIFGLFLIANSNPAVNSNDNTVPLLNRNQLEEGFIRKLTTKCSQRDNHSCMMLKLIVYMNRIFKKSTIDITDNLKITENRNIELPAPDPEDDALLERAMKSDDEALGLLLAEKMWKFIRSRKLRYKLYDNADLTLMTESKGNLNLGISISPLDVYDEARGKKNQLGSMLMAAIITKIGVIGALIIKGLLLVSGKALIISKIALILAVIIGLKKLLAKKHVTYEVVAHSGGGHQAHDSYSSGWARALDGFLENITEIPGKMLDVHDIVFSAQKPEQFQTKFS